MRNYALPLFSLVLLASCSNEESMGLEPSTNSQIMTKAQVLTAPLDKQIAYKRHHLKVLAQWVASERAAINVDASESFQKNQVAEQTFYLENLVNEIGVTQKSSKLFTKESVVSALDAFKNMDGETYLPVITVHESGILGQKSGSSNEETLIVIEDNDLDGETYAAYLMGEDDGLEEYLGDLDNPTVAGLPLLVIELDPCGANTVVASDINGASPCVSNTLGGGGGFGGGSSFQSLVIDKMTIRDRKEGAPFRSEIRMKAYKISDLRPNLYYDCAENVFSSVNCYSSNGNEIVQLKRKWQNDERTYNFEIERNNNFSNDILVYLIFEADSFPAIVDVDYRGLPNNSDIGIPYRSYQSPYDMQVLSQNSNYNLPLVFGHVTDFNTIKYNLASRW
jgi:hypothetical protein